ncbi:hypothetical protein [Ammoniphilus sp. CFH 90114]|uniref:DUF6115 domain-containing protein n=1 Tax=Ammoniphilus sp. CFH 90114 TaxID=2493665 RepID=UPI001010045C|nr:hypothetical protein [Ammoniphilus sp. CFH 90114]RXT15141.1 hypothetical protein EIZ39_02725 [Ammoniphilus sp. CFH 90114]
MDGWIYLVLLFGIFIGLVLFFTKNKKEPAEQQTLQMMQSFANELVAENQRITQTMMEINKQTSVKIVEIQKTLQQLEYRITQLEERAWKEQNVSNSSSEEDQQVRDILHLRNRYKEVFDLYYKGLSIEEISKKLGYGKGELELILQLSGKR